MTARDNNGKTTLHYCVENNEVQIAQLILEAEPGLLNRVDNEDYSALQLAVIAGNTPLINFFISEGADLASADKEGHTVVHWATGQFVKYRAVYCPLADPGGRIWRAP